jgi:hypothetical protein
LVGHRFEFLSNDADPFTDKGQQMVDELTHWLDRDRED